MTFEEAVAGAELILTEGSMYERLRRHGVAAWDAHVAHASLVYDDAAAQILASVHREYIAVARTHGVPMMVGAATWRANRERLDRSELSSRRVNQDNVAFIKSICAAQTSERAPLYVAAGLGPRGDAYSPHEGLDADTAERFHAYQAEARWKRPGCPTC